jgi:DNA-binding Xre family transcriptional regulator
MLNKNLLKAAIAKAGYTQEKLAKSIGISSNTFSSRMVGTSCFNVDEIDKICSILNIVDNSEKADIFLSSISQNRENKLL